MATAFEYHSTRFDDGEQRLVYAHVVGTNLGYRGQRSRVGRQSAFWSFFHQVGTAEPRRVGPQFPTRETLLAAMEQYGVEFGF